MLIKITTNKKEIITFILLAFLIPLLCKLGLLFLPDSVLSELISLILYGIEAASPALAAILTVLAISGFTDLKSFLRTKYLNNLSLKCCILGYCLPMGLFILSKIISLLFIEMENIFIPISSKKLMIIAWALIAEELGWRGFLQERLDKVCSEWITPAVLGIIWTLWHYHFFIGDGYTVPVVLFGIGCILESYGYSFIVKLSKGNIVPASLWHFSGNLYINLLGIYPQWNNDSIIPYFISTILNLFYLGMFIKLNKKSKK